MSNIIHFTPDSGADHTPMVRKALSNPACRGLCFAPGRYDFHTAGAAERYLFVSNNDEGLKRIVFLLEELSNFAIEGQGAQFVFHGGLMPFHLKDCHGLRLAGFSIDWAVPFHGEVTVLESDETGVDVEVPAAFPFAVEDGRLMFGPDPATFEIRNILEFDPVRRETAFLVYDNFGIGRRCVARTTGSRTVRLEAVFREPRPQPGHVLAVVSDRRDYPAITAANCSNIKLEDVAIHHAGGMGFIAQRSENIEVLRLKVAPPPDGTRVISTTADATHFVNCRGEILLEDCRFENQMDDPSNIHGIYAPVTRVLGPTEFEVRLAHPQQWGFEFAAPGEQLELVDGRTLATWHTALAAEIRRVNKEFLVIRLESPPPRTPRLGDAMGNLSWSANVTIRHCVARGNRARGFLVSTPGRVLVEENTIHSPGAGILIEGDANFWFESGAVRDILIRRNTFEDCKYGIWGHAVIQISPGLADSGPEVSSYHRNIRIEENLFRAFDPRIVRARGVEGLVIRGNLILPSANYPAQHTGAPAFDTEGCREVVIENNQLETPSHVTSHPA